MLFELTERAPAKRRCDERVELRRYERQKDGAREQRNMLRRGERSIARVIHCSRSGAHTPIYARSAYALLFSRVYARLYYERALRAACARASEAFELFTVRVLPARLKMPRHIMRYVIL